MEPMKAPAAESPANLRKHTIGGPERLGFKESEELELMVGLGLGLGFSEPVSESGYEGSAVDIVYLSKCSSDSLPSD